MGTINRRTFLGFGAAGVALGGMRGLPGLGGTAHAATPMAGDKKVLLIFLRGGNDGTNSVIPVSDPEYYAARPTLAIPSGQTLDLGNGWAAMHPSLAKLHELHELGEVASIQRVGYPDGNLSHFRGQRYIETAEPGANLADEGFVTRWANLEMSGSPLPAVSVSKEIQRMFKGSPAMPHIPSISAFTYGDDAAAAKLAGNAQSGLRAVYGLGSGALREHVNESCTAMLSTADLVTSLPTHSPPPEYYPTEESILDSQGLAADNWVSNYFGELRDAVRLLKFSQARVVGVEIPLWDHHGNQGGLTGDHPNHLHALAHGIRSVRLDTLSDIWNDLAIVVISEFGRTSAENGSAGTDHGKGGVAWVIGGNVRGGVYNCDSNTWPANNTLFTDGDKWLAHLIDYRTVLAEVFQSHLGTAPGNLDTIFPGWAGLSGSEYEYLDLFI